MLPFYARHFDTLEIDSSFYGTPAISTVQRWYDCTPDDFRFALKFPKTITHDKFLRGCDAELAEFLRSADELRDKLGPLLLQFPYFRQGEVRQEDFLGRLRDFLPSLPKDFSFAVEIRNRSWLGAETRDLLRERNIALALIDHPYMSRPAELLELDPLTADFTYVRLLGDRLGIEEKTKVWDQVIEDRTPELREWVDVCRAITRRGLSTHVYVNNHYAGHAPATVRAFLRMWKSQE
ncbi:MAG TPA: DUF72 domain-containing protein [Thermoanaerobaculia bacterium]|nr:DUF72 domain-containing protein [Thermoanaerobaculia bacterium]